MLTAGRNVIYGASVTGALLYKSTFPTDITCITYTKHHQAKEYSTDNITYHVDYVIRMGTALEKQRT